MHWSTTSASRPHSRPASSRPDRREATDEAVKYEKIFTDCVNAPKFGNADPYVRSTSWCTTRTSMTALMPTLKSYYGKPLYMCQISVSTHGPQGAITLAFRRRPPCWRYLRRRLRLACRQHGQERHLRSVHLCYLLRPLQEPERSDERQDSPERRGRHQRYSQAARRHPRLHAQGWLPRPVQHYVFQDAARGPEEA